MEFKEITLKGHGKAELARIAQEVASRFEQLDVSAELPEIHSRKPEAWLAVVDSPIVREKLLKMADLGWSLLAIQRLIQNRLAIKLSRPEVGRMMRHVLGAERYAQQYNNRYLFEQYSSSRKQAAESSENPVQIPPSAPASPPQSPPQFDDNWFS